MDGMWMVVVVTVIDIMSVSKLQSVLLNVKNVGIINVHHVLTENTYTTVIVFQVVQRTHILVQINVCLAQLV